MALKTEYTTIPTSESIVTHEGFIENIKITTDVCPKQIFIVTSSQQFIVYSNYKKVYGKEKSMYSFEYVRNFDKRIDKVEMEAIEGKVVVKGNFITENWEDIKPE